MSYDINDGTERWRANRAGQSAENDPGCFKKGGKTAVKIRVYSAYNLTFDTSVTVKGNVSWVDEYITGGNYNETSATFSAGAEGWDTQTGEILSSGDTSDFVDYDQSTNIAWSYKVPSGTDTWYGMGDSNNLLYRIVWGYYKYGAPTSNSEAFAYGHYTKEHVEDACKWGYNALDPTTTLSKLANTVCHSVHRSTLGNDKNWTVSDCWGIHSTSDGDCAHLAHNMAYVLRCLGVSQNGAFANLRSALNTTPLWNGEAHCDTHDVDVTKGGDSPFTSNNWQACTYMTIASPARDTICWDVQHDKHGKKYWELGNDKSDPADAPGGRFGILYNYHWREGGGGALQQALTGDNHDNCSLIIDYEHHGN